jgi:hypothetical protein
MSEWARRQSWVRRKQTRWEQYKGSQLWYNLKAEALKFAGNRCQNNEECEQYRCKKTTQLELHHDNYPNCPENDAISNVRILCRDCHENFHYHNGMSDCIPPSISFIKRQVKADAAKKFLSKYEFTTDVEKPQ